MGLYRIDPLIAEESDLGSSVRCFLNPGSKELDVFFIPHLITCPPAKSATKNDMAFPTFIAEVAYTHESYSQLMEELEAWLGPNTTVQLALGIHLKKLTSNKVILQAILKGRDRTTKIVDFGTGYESVPQVLDIPLEKLLWGTPYQTLYTGRTICVDLALIRRKVLETNEFKSLQT